MDDTLLLQLLSRDQSRRIRVIENLMVGRRTVSTLYWGMRYGLLNWLGFNKHLQRQTVEAALAKLAAANLVTVADLVVTLTEAGEIKKQAVQKSWYQPVVQNQWLLVDYVGAWQGLLLASQVTSEYAADNWQYYPVQVPFSIRLAVKRWFRGHPEQLGGLMADELTTFLTSQNATTADIYMSLLVGHDTAGLTMGQLAGITQKSELEISVIVADMTVALVTTVTTQPNQFPVLASLLKNWAGFPASESAMLTLANFEAGQTLTQISQSRRLKQSTVNEHLLEDAIFLTYDQFPYGALLPPDVQQELAARLTGAIDEWSFSALADLDVGFWQFRLYEIMRSKLTDDNHDGKTL